MTVVAGLLSGPAAAGTAVASDISLPLADDAGGITGGSALSTAQVEQRLSDTAAWLSDPKGLPPLGSPRPSRDAAPTRSPDIAEQSARRQSVQPQVINGAPIPITDAPWQVALLSSANSNPFQAQFCGGSVYTEEWIITAAHCVPRTHPSEIDVMAGVDFLANTPSGPGGRTAVDRIIIHPGFDSDTYDNDIALLHLASPLTFDDSVQPVSLPDFDTWPANGTPAFISGWGNTSTSVDAFPQALQGATVEVIGSPSDATCGDYGDAYDADIMLCAGQQTPPIIDTCQGDSGGPLAIEVGSTWYLAGITSWGNACARAGYPGIYTRVTAFTAWIRDMVMPGSTGSVSLTISPQLASPGMCLDLYPNSQIGNALISRCDLATDDTITIDDVAPGEYLARAYFADDFAIPFWYSSEGPQSSRANADPVSISQGGETELAMTPEIGGAIQVTYGPDDPLASADICVGAWGERLQDYVATDCVGLDDTVATLRGLPVDDTYYLFSYDSYGEYADQWYSASVSTGVAALEAATPLSVASAVTVEVDMELTLPSFITGTILDANDDTLPDQRARATVWLGPGQPQAWINSRPADDTGNYVLGYLPPGSYSIEFFDAEGLHLTEWYEDDTSWSTSQPVVLVAGEVKTGIDARLAAGGAIVGDVSAVAAAPLVESSNVLVGAYDPDTLSEVGWGNVKADGTYRIGGLPADDYIVKFYDTTDFYAPEWYDDTAQSAAALGVTVVAGQVTSDISAEMGRASLDVTSGSDDTVGARTAVTIKLVDGFGEAYAPSADLPLQLASSQGVGEYYAAPSGGSAITSTTLPSLDDSVTVWFTSSRAGDDTLTVSAPGAGPLAGEDVISFLPGPADGLDLAPMGGSLTSGSSASVVATVVDVYGNTVTADNSTVVTFSQSAGSGSVSGLGLATASSGEARRTITGGTPGSVTILASSSWGDDSTTFSVTAAPVPPGPTPPLEKPGVPQGVTVSSGSEAGSVAVTWSPPIRGGVPTGYRVEYRPAAGGDWVSQTVASTVTTTTISGLEPGRAYAARVAAANSSGLSDYAETTVAAVATLSGPASLEARPGSRPGTLAVTWSAVTGASSYVLEHREVGSTEWIRELESARGTAVTVSGLTPGSSYSIRVAARVAGADTAFTPSASAVRATADPTPPGPVTRLAPGEAEGTQGGESIDLVSTPEGDDTGLTVTGPGFRVGLGASNASGRQSRLGSQGQLRLTPGGGLAFAGAGFGGDQVDVYLLTLRSARLEPSGYLGSIAVSEDGVVSGTLEIQTGIAAGDVVLRLMSTAPGGASRVVSLGVTVRSEMKPSIVITGTRVGQGGQSRIVVTGVTTGLAGIRLTPFTRLAGQSTFDPGRPFAPGSSGDFRWTRKTTKKVTVYMQAGDVRSNRVTIRGSRS